MTAPASAPHPNPLPRCHNGERGRAASRMSAIASLLLAVLLVALGLASRPPPSPTPSFLPLTGRIVDEAALLSADDKRALERS